MRSCAADWDDAARPAARVRRLERGDPRPGLRAFDPATGTWDGSSATPRRAVPARRRGGPASSSSTRPRPRARVRWHERPVLRRPLVAVARLAELDPPRSARAPTARGAATRWRSTPEGDALWLFGGTRPGADLGDLWRLDLATGTWSEIAPECARGCPSPVWRDVDRTTRPATGSCSTAAGSRRATSTDARRGSSTISTARRRGGGRRPLVNLRRPGSSTSPATTPTPAAGRVRRGCQRQRVQGRLRADVAARRVGAGVAHPVPDDGITARDQVTVVLDGGVLTAFGGFGSGTFPGSIGAGTHLADTWQREPPAPCRRGASPRRPKRPGADRPRGHGVRPRRERPPAAAVRRPHRRHDAGRRLDGDLRRPGRPRLEQLCSPTSCGPGPSARWGAHAVYDPVADRLVVFGGSTGTGSTTNDVWALDLSGPPTWHELTPAGPAPAAGGARATATTPSAGVSSCSAARPAGRHRHARCRTRGRWRSTATPAGRRSPTRATAGGPPQPGRGGASRARWRRSSSIATRTDRVDRGSSQRRVVARSRRRLCPMGSARRRLAEHGARSPALGQRRLGSRRRPARHRVRPRRRSVLRRDLVVRPERTSLVSGAGLRGHVLDDPLRLLRRLGSSVTLEQCPSRSRRRCASRAGT